MWIGVVGRSIAQYTVYACLLCGEYLGGNPVSTVVNVGGVEPRDTASVDRLYAPFVIHVGLDHHSFLCNSLLLPSSV